MMVHFQLIGKIWISELEGESAYCKWRAKKARLQDIPLCCPRRGIVQHVTKMDHLMEVFVKTVNFMQATI